MPTQIKQPSSTQDPYVIRTNCCIFPHHHYNPENNLKYQRKKEGGQIEGDPDRVCSVRTLFNIPASISEIQHVFLYIRADSSVFHVECTVVWWWDGQKARHSVAVGYDECCREFVIDFLIWAYILYDASPEI